MEDKDLKWAHTSRHLVHGCEVLIGGVRQEWEGE